MAEVMSNEDMTVIVLSGRESAALADLMLMAGDPMQHAVLHDLYGAFGVPLGVPQ